MRHDRGHVAAVGVFLGVAMLPIVFYFAWKGFHPMDEDSMSEEDRDDDQHDPGDDDDDFEEVDDSDSDNDDEHLVRSNNVMDGSDDDCGPESFFALYLDPHILISSGRYQDVQANLTNAQLRMMEDIATKLDLQEGMHVLEIGCGWGELSLYLARIHRVIVTVFVHNRAHVAAAMRQVEREGLNVRFVHGQSIEEVGTGVFNRIIRVAITDMDKPVPEDQFLNRLALGGKALVYHATRPSIPPRPATNAGFEIEREDITNSFVQTLQWWKDTLRGHETYGGLQVPDVGAAEWLAHVRFIHEELETGARRLDQVMYTKRIGIRRDGRVVDRSLTI